MKFSETLISKKNTLILLSVLVFSLSARNFILLSKDIIYGDFSAEAIFPQPMYGLYRIPDRPNTIEHNAVNRLASDFAQVYFPSQDFQSLTHNYETGVLDPWWRPSRYAPAIHYLCAKTICKLNYGYASFFHILIQIFLLYLLFILSFNLLKITLHLWEGMLLVTFLLFVTPAGLSFIERGQFSFYVAISSLLLIIGLSRNNIILIVASALFAYIKWTSFPYLFIVMVVYWLSARNLREIIGNTQKALVYLLVILTLSLAFRSRFLHFLDGILWQELNAQPEGISIALLLHPTLVKWLPLALILIGGLYARKYHYKDANLVPFLAGSGILMSTYPTVAHEYNIPWLYCFIPLAYYWKEKADTQNRSAIYFFVIFMLLASYTNYLAPTFNKSIIVVTYLIFSITLMFFPLLLSRQQRNKTVKG